MAFSAFIVIPFVNKRKGQYYTIQMHNINTRLIDNCQGSGVIPHSYLPCGYIHLVFQLKNIV